MTLTNIEDVKTKNLTVGSVRGTMRAKLLADMGIKIDEVASHTQNLKKLQAGRIPLVALSDIELKTASDIAGVSTKEFEPALVFSETGSFLAFSKETPKDVVDKWQKAFADLQKGDFFARTARKWSTAVEAEMFFSSEKGLFIK
jgi:ABC-type amino acid transport substrate-binding protein